MTLSRRGFLARATAATTAVALPRHLVAESLWARPAAALIPEPDEAALKQLALTAIDAARGAGASFADIRLTATRYIRLSTGWSRSNDDANLGMMPPWVAFPVEYGLRVIVDGAWGFVGDLELTTDAVARAARTAVAVARANRPRRQRTLELAPVAPVAQGQWATPVAQDPLEVPLGEQVERQFAALAEASKFKDVTVAHLNFEWRRPTTVFASTDGSLIVQRFTCAMPTGSIRAQPGSDQAEEVKVFLRGLDFGGYGYEAVDSARLVSAIQEGAERATALARAARTPAPVEVGRYDLVCAPEVVTTLLTRTLADAVDIERALGYYANEAGTSFAAPPLDILGQYRAASPLLTVRGERARPHGGATTGWDDEGVKPEPYTFIQDGVFVDYHTMRDTAPTLGPWYRRRGVPVRAHGLARACGGKRPRIRLPNLTVEPGRDNTTADDLMRGVKKGLYIESIDEASVDQQLINAQFSVQHTAVRQITNGKLGRHLKHVAFQIVTPSFWKSVDAIGGAGSATVHAAYTGDGDPPDPFPLSTVTGVPLRARQVNVLNTGRTA